MVPALSGLVLALVVLLAVLVLLAALVCLLLVAAFVLVLLLERVGVDVHSARTRRRAATAALPAVPPLLPRRRPSPRAGAGTGTGAGRSTGTSAPADADRNAPPATAQSAAGIAPSGTIQQTASMEPEAAAPTEPFRRPVTRSTARPSAAAPSSASADTADDLSSTSRAQDSAPRTVPTRSRPVRRPRPPASPEVAREREAAMDRLFAPLTEDDRTRPLPRAGGDQRAED